MTMKRANKSPEKPKEKVELSKKPMEKCPKKRKAGKNNADKPLREKAKRGKSPEELGKGDESAQKSGRKGDEK